MRVLILLLVLALAAGGCGAVDDVRKEADKRAQQVKETARELRRDAEKLRKRVVARVNKVLADLRGVVPRASRETVAPSRRVATSFQDFLGDVLGSVDRYWGRTFAAADIPRPRVNHAWVAPGEIVGTACESEADAQAAFYCPADDTIYIGESIGRDVLEGIGDFGVAYIVAHEYAHNVQQELGWFEAGVRVTTVAPVELQADCMAGAWGYAVYQEGIVDEADVEEAVGTAYAVGDFDLTNPQHHGTPDERAGAWTRGYTTGDPSRCRAFVTG